MSTHNIFFGEIRKKHQYFLVEKVFYLDYVTVLRYVSDAFTRNCANKFFD